MDDTCPRCRKPLRLASHIDNPFVALQQQYSKAMVEALNLFRDLRDDLIERIFHAVYGSPWLRLPAALRPPPGDAGGAAACRLRSSPAWP